MTTKKVVYECDTCRETYGHFRDAQECERRHLKFPRPATSCPGCMEHGHCDAHPPPVIRNG